MVIRLLTIDDLEVIKEYLAPYKAYNMFIYSNFMVSGMNIEAQILKVSILAIFDKCDNDIERLSGVIGSIYKDQLWVHTGLRRS